MGSRPNLFIVGAPKCGTTSMHDYLTQHPDVAEGSLKEPHFFNEDHHEYRHVRSVDEYLRLFDRRRSHKAKYVIDSSTNYLYSKVAIHNILAFESAAKILVMLRHPADLVRSLHDHFVFKQSEVQTKLAVAWKLGPLRERAPDFVKRHPFPGHLSYREAGKLGENVQRIVDIVPPNNLHLIFFSDLLHCREKVIDELFAFLGLDARHGMTFEKRNQAKTLMSPMVNRMLLYPPPRIRSFKAKIKKLLPKSFVQRLDIYAWLSSGSKARTKMSPELRSEMIDFFAEDILLLSRLTSRDLSSWIDQ